MQPASCQGRPSPIRLMRARSEESTTGRGLVYDVIYIAGTQLQSSTEF